MAFVSTEGDRRPPLVLAAAVLAMFDVMLTLGLVTVAAANSSVFFDLTRALTPLAFPAGVAPIILGGLLLHRQRGDPSQRSSRVWAIAGIFAGLTLAGVIIAAPVIRVSLAILAA